MLARGGGLVLLSCSVIAAFAIAACGHDRSSTTARATLVASSRTPVQTAPSGSETTRCADCHRAQAEEWNASLHHGAFTDADFQASFKAEPLAFCFDCHAPEAKGNQNDLRAASIGVGCASCHTVSDGHGTRIANTATTTTTDCASCHEFSFPKRAPLMQSTMTEHRESPLASVSCASCHLPRAADGHRDHRFDVSRNEALLRSAIDVQSRRAKDGAVELTLKTRGVGHAMPTGDLFRRLRVVAFAEDKDGHLLGDQEILLGRHFDRRGGIPTPTKDDRIFGERRVNLDGEWITRASRISIEVRYDRVAQTMEIESPMGVGLPPGERPRRETLFASVVLAEISIGAGANASASNSVASVKGER